jgi:hypothetical protein
MYQYLHCPFLDPCENLLFGQLKGAKFITQPEGLIKEFFWNNGAANSWITLLHDIKPGSSGLVVHVDNFHASLGHGILGLLLQSTNLLLKIDFLQMLVPDGILGGYRCQLNDRCRIGDR